MLVACVFFKIFLKLQRYQWMVHYMELERAEKKKKKQSSWHKEEEAAEDGMVGWHHRLNEHEFEQTLGDTGGQGSLACCCSWSRKESDMTEHLNSNNFVLEKSTGLPRQNKGSKTRLGVSLEDMHTPALSRRERWSGVCIRILHSRWLVFCLLGETQQTCENKPVSLAFPTVRTVPNPLVIGEPY